MTLRLEREGHVARLLIDRPDKRNAMNQAMWKALPALVDEAMADEGVRILLLGSSAPGMFCAGADIDEFARCVGEHAWRAANQQAIRASQYARLCTQAGDRGDLGRLCGRRLRPGDRLRHAHRCA
ncbi:hypothetical protein BH10PSE12_BH10PSE12_31140 [soil metagenome]